MAKNYTSALDNTPQVEKAKENQVVNNAGGFVFKVDDWNRLNRFLILGSDKNSYYSSSGKLTRENARVVENLLKSDGKKVVDKIVEISQSGRAAKNDPAIFALALAASCDDDETRKYALDNLDKVCRIGTFLFTFATYVDDLRGWGSGLQKAISRWYNEMSVDRLSVQVCKYVSRRVEGEKPWSHRDLLRKAHTVPVDEDHNKVYQYVTQGRESFTDEEWNSLSDTDMKYIYYHEAAKNADSAGELSELISEHGLFHESVPSDFKNEPEVQKALLPHMPVTATMRSLGSLTKSGVLSSMSDASKVVIDKLSDEQNIKKARLHPLNILNALRTYGSGTGFRGSSSWTPVQSVVDVLEDAFYKSFENVDPTGERMYIGLDVSGSMSCSYGQILTPREISAAFAMVFARTEKQYVMKGFSNSMRKIDITAKDSLNSVISKISNLPFGGTDCSLPMRDALKNKIPVDTFLVITDNETWSGSMHPYEALKKYRKEMNIPDAKLVVLATEPTEFSIADPDDAGMLDIAGFDSAVPQIVSEFIKGNV